MKPWYKSKTIWASVLVGAVGVMEAIDKSGTLAEHAGIITIGIAALKFGLRFVTTTGIGSGSQ